jgi:lysyl-tRNA synthetase class 2
VVFRNSRDIPRIGLAALQAEGYLELGLPRALRRRKPAEPRPCAHVPTARPAQDTVERAA